MATPDFDLIFIPNDFSVDRYIDAVLACVADLKERGIDHLVPADGLPAEVEAALRAALGRRPGRAVAAEGAA